MKNKDVIGKDMSKKKKRNKKDEFLDEGERLGGLKDETLQAVVAILFLALGVFFGLAVLHAAGVAGEHVYTILSNLLGVGYFLLPVLCFILATFFFKSLHRKIQKLQLIGSILFFLSALGIIEVMVRGEGGMIGSFVAHPLISLFDSFAAFIILAAIFIISILILFNTTVRLEMLAFWRKKKEIESTETEKKAIAEAIHSLDTPSVQELKLSGMTGAKVEAKEKPKKDIGEAPDFKIEPLKIGTKEYIPPPLSLLLLDSGKPGVGDIKANANIIKRTLQNFGIIVEMDEITIGPSVTRYAFKPAEGVKLSKILGLQTNLELALAAHPVRIEAPIPGKSLVGIEVPNTSKAKIGLGSLLSGEEFQNSAEPLMMALGKGISGNVHYKNLGKMPHLLIAGSTGSGKSVTIHALITSLLYRNSPENLKFIMVDPKRVELTLYNKIPHLLTPVITEPKKAILSLKWAAKEMERRYEILNKFQVRDIESYHKNILKPELEKLKKKGGQIAAGETPPELMPYIVVAIDELADIMQAYPRELEAAIVRLAQMSRAVGIHLILSTQRPSVNVITGLIKANVPARIALQVVSFIDSRTILDTGGAEKLLGAGDMLYITGDISKPVRVQSAFISENEVKGVVKYLADTYQDEIPSMINLDSEGGKGAMFSDNFDDEDEDDLYEEAREIVVQAGKASTSFLQRKLSIGYARAAKIIDMLEERGVVGPASGSKPRDVIGAAPSATEFGADEQNSV